MAGKLIASAQSYKREFRMRHPVLEYWMNCWDQVLGEWIAGSSASDTSSSSQKVVDERTVVQSGGMHRERSEATCPLSVVEHRSWGRSSGFNSMLVTRLYQFLSNRCRSRINRGRIFLMAFAHSDWLWFKLSRVLIGKLNSLLKLSFHSDNCDIESD